MEKTTVVNFNNDVSWNQSARHGNDVFREIKFFSDVVALPKQGDMLRENLNKVMNQGFYNNFSHMWRNVSLCRSAISIWVRAQNLERMSLLCKGNSIYGAKYYGEFILLFCSTAKHLHYQHSVKANCSKCYSRYTMQLSDKAPNYQLIVTQLRINYTRVE